MKRVEFAITLVAVAGAAVSGYLIRGASAQTTAPAGGPATAETIAPYEAQSQERIDKSTRHGEWVDLDVPGHDKKMRCWIVHPQRADKAPVVLVIMEIFGMSPWVRATTDQLAANGFIAIAPDFLTGMGPSGANIDNADQARGVITRIPQADISKDLNAARDYALALPSASGKSASIGFCWGGGMSFSYAVDQPALDAAVVFYGTPPKADDLAKIKAPVAGFYGGNDNRITSTVAATTTTMKSLQKVYEPHVYDGAGHGFMRAHGPSDPAANRKAADEAWPLVIKFLNEHTK